VVTSAGQELRAAGGTLAARAEAKASAPVGVEAILGRSPGVVALRRDILAIARSRASSVLLTGETGTGKDLVARAIHEESERRAGPFVAVNCSALPENLLEAEFFGYEAGAFTDARHKKQGLLEIADGGTLFLDELSELGLALQAKLLRVLEDQRFRRLGGTRDVSVDVRFVAATNVDLREASRHGRFRRDLYYRIGVVALATPPLRERREDVPLLARHFLERYATRFHKRFEGFEPAALEALEAHAWPGNVRELKNAIERAVLLEEGPLVTRAMLPIDATVGLPAEPPAGEPGAGEDLDLERLELRALARALELSGGNQSLAARRLGVSRDTVRYRMQKYGVRIETRVVVGRPPA
jgi:two-component system response regulator HydG